MKKEFVFSIQEDSMKFKEIEKAKKILIYGYGKEGQSSHKFLSKKFPKIKIELFDEDPFSPIFKKKSFPDSKDLISGKYFEDFDLIVLSPGVAREKLSHVNHKKITSNTEIFFDNIPEELRKKVIGISGTKGKSTTTKFCAELLKNTGFKTRACGNFGVPLLDVYEKYAKGSVDYLVVELSSYQLEYLEISPGVAVFLNLYPDHLDRHKTYDNYFGAKQNLWKYQKAGDTMIYPKSIHSFFLGMKFSGVVLKSIPMKASAFPKGSIFQAAHFLENFGTIKKLAEFLNIPEKTIDRTAHEFKGLPHRLEFFAEKNGIKFYDDAISTNPDSTLASIKFFGDKLGTIILGGKDRGNSFDKLVRTIKEETGAQMIVLDSEVSSSIQSSCLRGGQRKCTRCEHAEDLAAAVECAFEITPSGKVCLLSTAAPSYGLFKNFEEKGCLFKEYVKRYK